MVIASSFVHRGLVMQKVNAKKRNRNNSEEDAASHVKNKLPKLEARKGNEDFLEELLLDVEHFSFCLYKITESFNPTSPFSQVELNMTPFKSTAEARAVELYRLDQLEITDENKNSMNFICTCDQVSWPPKVKQKRESATFIEISQQLLAPLTETNEVILDSTYRSYLKHSFQAMKFQIQG